MLPGAVVPPRETIANIVPNDPKLVIEAHIRTEDVSRVHQGQIAEVRFTAYKYRITRKVEGKVLYVAADRSVDRVNGSPYYVVSAGGRTRLTGQGRRHQVAGGYAGRGLYQRGRANPPPIPAPATDPVSAQRRPRRLRVETLKRHAYPHVVRHFLPQAGSTTQECCSGHLR